MGNLVIQEKVTAVTDTTTYASFLQTKIGIILCNKKEVNFMLSWQSLSEALSYLHVIGRNYNYFFQQSALEFHLGRNCFYLKKYSRSLLI